MRPCPLGFQLGNWRVEERPDIYATSIISNDESLEDTNIGDPAVNFEQEANRVENEEDEDIGLRLEVERIIAQEGGEIRQHEEETKLVDLGTDNGRREVEVGTGMTAPIRKELMALLKNYQDIFAWSYQDMPGLSSDIIQHRLPLNPECSPVKKKLRRMKLETSLKIKEEVKKQ